MKKLALLALAVCLALTAVPAMAKVTVGEWVVIDEIGYTTGAPRYFNPGEAWGNQEAQVKLPMSALIPCYLEMTFQGNDVNVRLESWGPGDKENYAPGDFYIAFHPAVGGYIKTDWSLYPNSNSNLFEAPLAELGDPTVLSWIRACDTFKAVLWSNMNYKYTVAVKDGGLKGGLDSQAILPVDMRAAISETDPGLTGAVWNFAHDFKTQGTEALLVNGGNFLSSTVIYQQFRVPYSREYSAGHYTGEITFTAATI